MNETNNLHILNGDSTKYIFDQSGIEGDVVVWREVFSEGTFKGTISEDAFWQHRQSELERLYAIPAAEYQQKTIDELNRIKSEYDEVIFWFEHDFFCQINLLGCLTFYRNHQHLATDQWSLVCVGEEQDKGRKSTLSDYRPDQYQKLFLDRQTLTDDDFTYIETLFDAYLDSDPNTFLNHIKSTSSFPYHQQMKTCFIDLFPLEHQKNSKLDALIKTLSIQYPDVSDLARFVLIQTPHYGFGDAQIFTKIKCMRDREKGTQVTDFIGNSNRFSWFFKLSHQKFFHLKR